MNYYEWLGVPATTDTDEIVRILDDCYTALRTLATHPNPAVARQAEIDREVVERRGPCWLTQRFGRPMTSRGVFLGRQT